MRGSKKLAFFCPAFASAEAAAPLSILAEVRDAMCVGISLVTGPMIREKAEIGRAMDISRLAYPVRWRLDNVCCDFPFELRLNRKITKSISAAKPKVDARQLEPVVGANCL